jgi:AAA domain/Bifunctional DNA primase/polymerase, N-terminal
VIPLDIALDYIRRGWNPVPIKYRAKGPTDDGWQRRIIDAGNAAPHFNGAQMNIGVVLGPSSHGLTDVDLDCAEARAIGPYILPRTDAIFGRASSRAAHRLYCTDLAVSSEKAVLTFNDPQSKARLLELRIGGDKGAQTVFPGSTHKETGEAITWEQSGEPARVTDAVLLRRVHDLAAYSLIARYWPKQSGSRHDCALMIGGFLARAGKATAEIKIIAEAIARAADDEEWRDRRQAAEDAACAYHTGQRTYGLTALRKQFSASIADQVAAWLGYHSEQDEDHREADPATEPSSPDLEVFDAGDDVQLPPPRGWLLGNQLCRRFLSSLVAPGGAGKTALRTAQLISAAIFRSLTGQHVFMRCRALLLSFEDDREELRRRIAAACIHHHIDSSELRGWLFYITPKGIKLAELVDGSPKRGDLERLLRTEILRLKPDIVCLDPFVKTHALEENSNSGMDFVCDLLATMAGAFDIAVDVPHHTRKGEAAPGDPDIGRGGSAIRDAARLVYTLTTMSENEAAQFGIDQGDRRTYIRLDSAKVNIARPARTATWFRLISVAIGNATEQYPAGDEVQTVEPWTPPDTWQGLSSVLLNAALTEIDIGLPNGQRYSDAATAAKARKSWCVVQKHCPDRSESQCREIIKAWVRNGVLYHESYDDPIERKKRIGLRLDQTKRPS